MELTIQGGTKKLSKTVIGVGAGTTVSGFNNYNNMVSPINSVPVVEIKTNRDPKVKKPVEKVKDEKKVETVQDDIGKAIKENLEIEPKKKTTGNIYTPNKNPNTKNKDKEVDVNTKDKKDIIVPPAALEFHGNESSEDIYNKIYQHISEINILWGILDESYKDKLKKELADLIEGMSLGTEKVDIVSTDPLEAILYHIKKFTDEFNNVEDSEEFERVLKDENLMNFFGRYYDVKSVITKISSDNSGENIELYQNYKVYANCEEDAIAIENMSDERILISADTLSQYIEQKSEVSEKIEDEIKNGDFKFFRAEVVNTNEIKPGSKYNKKILVLKKDGNPNFVTIGDKYILAIDHVNDKNLNNLSIVSRTWLDNMTRRIEMLDGKPMPIADETDDPIPDQPIMNPEG